MIVTVPLPVALRVASQLLGLLGLGRDADNVAMPAGDDPVMDQFTWVLLVTVYCPEAVVIVVDPEMDVLLPPQGLDIPLQLLLDEGIFIAVTVEKLWLTPSDLMI